MSPALRLVVLPGVLAVARLAPEAEVPSWAAEGVLTASVRTPGELSVVCAAEAVPAGVLVQGGWRVLRLEGPFAFELTGILSAVLLPLAAAGVPIFALSTYDTDWVLVPGERLGVAVSALRASGHTVG